MRWHKMIDHILTYHMMNCHTLTWAQCVFHPNPNKPLVITRPNHSILGARKTHRTHMYIYIYYIYACVYIYIYTYNYIHTSMHACIHTYMAWNGMALHYIALHSIALHLIPSYYITLHYTHDIYTVYKQHVQYMKWWRRDKACISFSLFNSWIILHLESAIGCYWSSLADWPPLCTPSDSQTQCPAGKSNLQREMATAVKPSAYQVCDWIYWMRTSTALCKAKW